MPLPRFERLPEERQRHILAVATQHVAQVGPAAASYSQIVAEAGISRTSAYLYFDGKDDLVAEVYRGLGARLTRALGAWSAADHAEGFWSQLRATSAALQRHLVDHPDDLALLASAPAELGQDFGQPWLEAALHDGRRLGVVRDDVPAPLMLAATQAVLRVGDEHVITAMLAGQPADDTPVWSLLRGLWSGPALPAAPR